MPRRTLIPIALAMLLGPLAVLLRADDPPAPEGQVVLFKLHAEGVQIYECEVNNPNARVELLQWVLKGPDAVLTDDKGAKVGRHYAGPTWEASDGSKVIGETPPAESTPKPPAVPWLLLKAKSAEGDGRFGKVTYIRRVDTEGGAAPLRPDAAYKGDELRVPYKATYIFYGAK
ncbi:MAG TPA: DUF3455 domain-containing protein [Gemmataceae bacterium]|nr:DUF3455 domain-containing protein [Gemmataceae bacterium]